MVLARNRFVSILIPLHAFCALVAIGCNQAAPPPVAIDFRKRLPEGVVALRKISPAEYPDFSISSLDAQRIRPAIANSLKYMSAGSSNSYYPYLDIGHDRAVATLQSLDALIVQQSQSSEWNAAAFNQQIRRQFDVYKSIGAPKSDGSGYSDRVLFTGYYTPILDASLTRTGPYQWPLYKLPPDLVRDPATGEVKGRRTADGSTVPYYTRGEIETGGKLAGDELVYLKSRWEEYVVTIQGSGRLRLPDGRVYEVGFSGMNGYEYTSPEGAMLADHVISEDAYNFKTLTAYFAAHPEAMDKYLTVNQRYIFFTERPGGPYGKLNVPVTPMATIATDKGATPGKDIYPRAMPAFLAVNIPVDSGGAQPFRGFMMDQDTGGAIRASGRCDIFMGIGAQAGALAGRELQEGELYYVAIKPEFMGAGR